jgi:hypothetical protein
MAIKSKFAFSNNCYKELLKLISDVFSANHKLARDMYQSKKLLSGLGMDYEKIDVCQDNCMLFESLSRPPCEFWCLNDKTIKELISFLSVKHEKYLVSVLKQSI